MDQCSKSYDSKTTIIQTRWFGPHWVLNCPTKQNKNNMKVA